MAAVCLSPSRIASSNLRWASWCLSARSVMADSSSSALSVERTVSAWLLGFSLGASGSSTSGSAFFSIACSRHRHAFATNALRLLGGMSANSSERCRLVSLRPMQGPAFVSGAGGFSPPTSPLPRTSALRAGRLPQPGAQVLEVTASELMAHRSAWWAKPHQSCHQLSSRDRAMSDNQPDRPLTLRALGGLLRQNRHGYLS
jgi:hypothetical protein